MERNFALPIRVPSVAGDAVLRPVVVAALVLLILNDHLLKAAWPGVVTGKLSDIAGLILFPIFLLSIIEFAQHARGRWHGPDRTIALICCALTASTFAAVKVVPMATDSYEVTLGFLQWLPAVAAALLTAQPLPAAWRVTLVADPTDLLALPAVVIAFWITRTREPAA